MAITIEQLVEAINKVVSPEGAAAREAADTAAKTKEKTEALKEKTAAIQKETAELQRQFDLIMRRTRPSNKG